MTATLIDATRLGDLIAFARIEQASHDLEPWAETLHWLWSYGTFDTETALWAVKLYNAYDDLGSAMSVLARWPSPRAWLAAPDRDEACAYPCTQERRNLRGGKVLIHLTSYAEHVAGLTQAAWLRLPLAGDAEADFGRLLVHMRRVWGVGRQTAFEWAEFVAKVIGLPVSAPHAFLWESEGPRRSIQRLYGNPYPTPSWLDIHAQRLKGTLAAADVELPWEDFETVICDFNVMRDGRYYPGRHLAALREEIDDAAPELRPELEAAWRAVIPEPWSGIVPGIDKAKLPVYRDTGRMVSGP